MRVGAVVFGVSDYVDETLNSGPNQLRYAADDARSFEHYAVAAWSTAEQLTIESHFDRDATFGQWQAAIDRIASARPDLFVVYLAGHAIHLDNQVTAFCLADARGHDAVLTASDIDDALEAVGASTSLLLMDCCHAEAVVSGAWFFRALNGDRARLFLCSARADQRAWEDDTIQHGLFSNAVIRGLSETSPLATLTGFVDVEALLFPFVSEDVAKRAFARKNRAHQEPVRGGISVGPVHLPTAAVASLGNQISTYEALAGGFRRWLARGSVLAAAIFVITDLSFQHLAINADGHIEARSGLHFLSPIRRILPGGVIETGFSTRDLSSVLQSDNGPFSALVHGRLTANRLHQSGAWPDKLAPLLNPGPHRDLSIGLTGRLPDDFSGSNSNTDGPPLSAFAALAGLKPETDYETLTKSLAYAIPSSDLDCRTDISTKIDFTHLNPATEKFLLELDWRIISAAARGDAAGAFSDIVEIVAYRFAVDTRERASGTENAAYDARLEFSRLADWAMGAGASQIAPPADEIKTWCAVPWTFVDAIVGDKERRQAAEADLLSLVRTYDRKTMGDLLGRQAETGLALLAIVARTRPLDADTIDAVSSFLRTDARGLNGPPDFANWLSSIAPTGPFPNATKVFLLNSLVAPEEEFEFRKISAFEILARHAAHLSKDDRAKMIVWARENRESFGRFDSYARGIAYLSAYLPPVEARGYATAFAARTTAARALAPPEATWRGNMLIAQTDVPEWLAVSRIARHVDLPEDLRPQLEAFAGIAAPGDGRRLALAATARQHDAINKADWSRFRRSLARLAADNRRRALLVESAGIHICAADEADRQAHFGTLRVLWSRERVPVIKLGLAGTIRHARLCGLTTLAWL